MSDNLLTEYELDVMGEVANISMGSAATTLFSLVNKKVEISTPVVTETNWNDLASGYDKSCVVVRIGYTKGLDGSNILVLKEDDVKQTDEEKIEMWILPGKRKRGEKESLTCFYGKFKNSKM